MKTLKQFEAIAQDFRNAIEGKIGDAFFGAVLQFMSDYDFENPVITMLYEADCGKIIFFTDHPLNDAGFVFTEIYDVKSGEPAMSCFYVGSKTEVKKAFKSGGDNP